MLGIKAGLQATVRTRHWTTDWFQIRKGVCQGYILSPCLFNLYAEYIMQNAGWKKHNLESRLLEENINKLRYIDGTTLIGRK